MPIITSLPFNLPAFVKRIDRMGFEFAQSEINLLAIRK